MTKGKIGKYMLSDSKPIREIAIAVGTAAVTLFSVYLTDGFTSSLYEGQQRIEGYLTLVDAMSKVHQAIERTAPRYFGPNKIYDPKDLTLDDRTAADLWNSYGEVSRANNRVLVFPSRDVETRRLANELTIYYMDVATKLSEIGSLATRAKADPTASAGLSILTTSLNARYGYVGECDITDSADKCQEDNFLTRGAITEQQKIDRDPSNLLIQLRRSIRDEIDD